MDSMNQSDQALDNRSGLTFGVIEQPRGRTVAAHPTCSNALVEDLFDGE